MSIKSWLAEFYPVDAQDAEDMTNLQAVRHSLQKWTGLRKENLAAHEVCIGEEYHPKAVVPIKRSKSFSNPDRILRIDNNTCALCVKHADVDFCRTCPLARARGRQCDRSAYFRKNTSPWRAWVDNFDPEPMIALLLKAEAALTKGRKAK